MERFRLRTSIFCERKGYFTVKVTFSTRSVMIHVDSSQRHILAIRFSDLPFRISNFRLLAAWSASLTYVPILAHLCLLHKTAADDVG